MGDPAGIGPEIIAKALVDKDIYALCRPVILGDPTVLSSSISKCGQKISLNIIAGPSKARSRTGEMDVMAVSRLKSGQILPGKPTLEGGKAMVTISSGPWT
jgi:4-hydroxythreonine-4-phosphate dehydrogenase